MKKTVLVTGAAGYIGSVLVGKLLFKNYCVKGFDALFFGGESLLSYNRHPAFEFIKGDLRNEKDLKIALKGVDIVVHLAAIVGDPACRKYSDDAKEINGEAPKKLAKVAAEEGVTRFIFASTCSNYGKMDLKQGMFVNEDAPLRPISLYAELKVAFESYLLSDAPMDLTPVCLRFSTAFGLSPRPRFDLTVNEFTRELVLDRTLEVFGEQFWRPYCHTTDLAAAVLRAIEAPADLVRKEAFNVGKKDQNRTKKQIVESILEITGASRGNVNYVQKDEDPRDYRVDFSKIEKTLGYRSQVMVEEGILEIGRAVRMKQIGNPDSPRYRNI